MADIKFELSRLTSYSDEEIIREIQRVATKLNVSPLTGKAFNKESKVNRTTVNRRFGGWEKALEAAGLSHLYSGQNVTENMRLQKNKGLTDEELLDELRRVSKVVERKDISTGDVKNHSAVLRDTFSHRFGSWEKAVELAGLDRRVPGAARRIHTHEDVFKNLYDIWIYYGRQPHYSEMNKPPSKIKSKNYTNRFGTWRKALLAFIDYMNQSSEEPKAPSESINTPLPEKRTTVENKQRPENRREISLGLRFKVLYRDHFKCVLCGDNPPSSPGLKLHIDHIVPWSKDGKTKIDNLRTLCEACNLGRGNRYID